MYNTFCVLTVFFIFSVISKAVNYTPNLVSFISPVDMSTVIKTIEIIFQFVLHAAIIIISLPLVPFSNHNVAANQY